MNATGFSLFPVALQAELDDMDAGPILRDIMLGGGGQFGDDDFDLSDFALSELAISATASEPSETSRHDGREVSPPKSPESTTAPADTGRRSRVRVVRPNYAVLAGGKSRGRSKGGSVSSSDEDGRGSPTSTGEADDAYFSSRGSCMSKNAIAARENRLKKKLYVHKLERSVRALTTENAELKRRTRDMTVEVEDLTEEVRYLKSVLANVDEISALVRNIRSSRPDVVTSLKTTGKRRPVEDHDYVGSNGGGVGVKGSNCAVSGPGGNGVCVHVADGTLSLEFCHRCASQSKKAKLEAQTG
ncbi:unnamed protein product [Ixodes persulcatus]